MFDWFNVCFDFSWELFETILDMDLSKKLYFSLLDTFEAFCILSYFFPTTGSSLIDLCVFSWMFDLETSISDTFLFFMILMDCWVTCTCSTFCLLLFLEWTDWAEWLEWMEMLLLSITLTMLEWEFLSMIEGAFRFWDLPIETAYAGSSAIDFNLFLVAYD